MNTELEDIKPETIALIESQANHFRISVDEYLRRLLPADERELALRPSTSEDDFEKDMAAFAEDAGTPSEYNGTYSREDIYFDHD